MANVPDNPHALPDGAAAAIDNATELLRPYQGDERVKALIAKLAVISDEGAADSDSTEQLAKAMAECEKIAKSDAAPHVRKRAADVRQELERGYLRRVSPAGSSHWETAAKAAGRAA